MLLAPHSRFFLRHELRFRTPRGHGVPLPFRAKNHLDIENVLQTAIGADKANLVLRNNDIVRLTMLDIRPRQNLAVLLFRRSDPEAATPIFEHAKTRKLRPSDKSPDEAVAVSSHLFVHLGAIADAAHPTYPAILEEVPGLSRSYIQALFHDVVKDTRYLYSDGRGAERETYTLVEFHGLKSEKVGGALKGDSIVPSVTLVRPGSVAGLDTEGMVVPRDQRMKLIIKAKPEQTLGVIKKIQSWMKVHDWPKFLIEVDMPENRTRLVALAREADAADILFVRSVPIDVKTRLEACSDVINEELVRKAKELFAADGL
jgi:hypothetical protein